MSGWSASTRVPSWRGAEAPVALRPPGLRAAAACTGITVVLVVVASTWGLLGHDVYQEGAWGEAAFRGGDLVSLVVAVPALVLGAVTAWRGSRAGALVWAGALGYSVYNYGYYAFGGHFNDLFLGHVVVLALSGWGLVFLLPAVRAGLPDTVWSGPSPRWEAVLLGAVAVVLGGLWSSAIVRQAVTGELPSGPAPVSGLHTVYAVDLTLFVSSLVVAAVLGWRRTAWGAVAVGVMTVAGAFYLANLLAAQAFQASAGVDVAAFSPLTGGLTVVFAAAAFSSVRTLRAAAPSRPR